MYLSDTALHFLFDSNYLDSLRDYIPGIPHPDCPDRRHTTSVSYTHLDVYKRQSLNDGVIQDDGTNVGVGTAPVANQKLTVAGKTTTTNLQMTAGAGANFVMQSDASGNASWVNVNTLNANNIYNSNGTLTGARTLTQGSNALTILNNGTQNTVINLSSTGDLDIQDNGVSTLYVDDSGNTGINTCLLYTSRCV